MKALPTIAAPETSGGMMHDKRRSVYARATEAFPTLGLAYSLLIEGIADAYAADLQQLGDGLVDVAGELGDWVRASWPIS